MTQVKQDRKIPLEKQMAEVVHAMINWIGRIVSLLIFVLIAILLYGVVARYIFDSPSVWVSEMSGMMYGCYFLLGGSYAMLHGDHVNVNLLRGCLTARGQAALDLLTYPFFYLFIGVIFWLGIDYSYSSLVKLERSSTVWGPPIWPVKLMLPVSAFLMLVAGLRKSMLDLMLLLGLDRADAR